MFKEGLFAGKVALVTGGRSGIGYAIAKMMLQLGAKVMIASRKEDLLKAAASELAEFGEVGYMACDIRKTDQIIELAAKIKADFGALDILINNAGGQFPTLAELTVDKGWDAVINNNLNGTFYMCREMGNAFFIPQKRGIIVNIIADIFRGFPGMIHTGAARAGVENITKTLALEWAQFNVRTVAVAPGIIDSSGLKTYPQPVQDMFDEGMKDIPMGRYGTVEDTANAVCFLASDLASYINGITLYVDGASHLGSNKMDFPGILRKMLETKP